MEYSFMNPFLKGLPLILDYHNIKNETYGEILNILKFSPSLVDDDIISIGEEIVIRIEREEFTQTHFNVCLVKNLFNLIKRIPNTIDLQYRIKSAYGNMINSPISSPVSPPPIPKKMKKPKNFIKKVCPF